MSRLPVWLSPSRRSLWSRVLAAGLGTFFHLLYTRLAWTYDLVAWTSSMGQWRAWQQVGLRDLPEGRVLELGHGPGHLLVDLLSLRPSVFGVDPSRQMSRLAARRLRRRRKPARLARASAGALPFPATAFGAVLASFPNEYILDPRTAHEARRVLLPGGCLVIIPSAEITGTAIYDRFARWLYAVTRQSGDVTDAWLEPLRRAGFDVEAEQVQLARACVWRVLARRPRD